MIKINSQPKKYSKKKKSHNLNFLQKKPLKKLEKQKKDYFKGIHAIFHRICEYQIIFSLKIFQF